MSIAILTLLLITTVFVVRTKRAPIRHRWCRQAQAMCAAFQGSDRGQAPGWIYARLPAMDALAFEDLLFESFAVQGHKVFCNHRCTGDRGIAGRALIAGQTWLVQAKRYASAIRPEHVAAFAVVCRRQGAHGLFTHSGRTSGLSRTALERFPHIGLVSGGRLLALVAGTLLSIGGDRI